MTTVYCRVLGVARPSPDSEIRFEVAVPSSPAWNGRYLQVGNSGFGGKIPEQAIAAALRAGFAVAGTDDGHQSSKGSDASWALHHPEKSVDFGYRALRETTVAAKAIIRAYARRAPLFSYFDGCADGGREALMEAQRYPEDFNGILAGNPSSRWTHLLVAAAWNLQALTGTPGSAISGWKLKVAQAAAVAACGDETGVIENPLSCHFDPSTLRCGHDDQPNCLTDAQLAALTKIYSGPRNPRTGAKIVDGFYPGEGAGSAVWLTSPGDREFLANVVFSDPSYDEHRLNFDSDVDLIDARWASVFNADNPDLSGFRKHGGKLIQYHGWADPAIPARDSVTYFESVQHRMGDTRGFYRLFMAPGMMHCRGGPGPNLVDAPAFAALVAWVEEGKPPARIDVAKRVGDTTAGAIERTRPLCPFPRVATFRGTGDRDRAENYRCARKTSPSKGA